MMPYEINSSIVIAASLLLSPNLPVQYSNSYNYIPIYQNVRFVENNSMPVHSNKDIFNNLVKKSGYSEALELFGEVRGFTKEEAKLYEESLSKLFVPTGDNFFDLL